MNLLGDDKEVTSEDIDQKAKEMDISQRTVREVKAELRKEGVLGSIRKGSQWTHFLKEKQREANP